MAEPEDEPTQPATQLIVDPRRLGEANSSDLSDEDLADICCILHPSSLPAYHAAAYIREQNPQNTIVNSGNVIIRENKNGNIEDIDKFDLDMLGVESCDIVLRLSANLKDPIGGFHFGRNQQRCDFIIGIQDQTRRVSNIHFRIYLNEHGVLMLEDQSTNGTAVDGDMLRAKDKENGVPYRHMLEHGSTVVLAMTPPELDYRFVVRIPHRDEESNDAYNENLTAWFLRMHNFRQQYEARVKAAGGVVKKDPRDLFSKNGQGMKTPSTLSSISKVSKEWRGGPKYNKVGLLGKGAFATVYKITAKYDGMPYAAKELEKRRFMKNGILDQKVEQEIDIMRKIQHPHVVRFVEHVDWEEYLYIIMELVPCGDLGSLVSKRGHLPEIEVRDMADQLLSAIKYLHSQRITHRDIKPDNILISQMDPIQIKLTDFGLSKIIDNEHTFLRTFCGTLLYCAPEVFPEYRHYDQGGKAKETLDRKSLPKPQYDESVDIWSLAGVLFYALCGSPPYPCGPGVGYLDLLKYIMTPGSLDVSPLQEAGVSRNGIRFVRTMLNPLPHQRATIEELEESPWMRDGTDGMIESQESVEEDEIDMVADEYVDPQLEVRASQLSLDPCSYDQDFVDSREMEDGDSDITEIRQPEIPSSFDTSEGNSHDSTEIESFDRFPEIVGAETNTNDRLFGEVNASAFASSGALDHLVLPVPSRAVHSVLPQHPGQSYESTSNYYQNESSSQASSMESDSTTNPNSMGPPQQPIPIVQVEADGRVARSSSLMGAESLVGHLNMHSPASATSPAAASPTPSTEDEYLQPAASLRRRRDDEEVNDDADWRPVDMPKKRQRVSQREIDVPVPASVFWKLTDKNTHHRNYPRMMSTEYNNWKAYAESKGEKFDHGHKTFDMAMQSFRASRSPSLDPEAALRAQSEPTIDEERRTLLKRDERQLQEEEEDEKEEMENVGDDDKENSRFTAGLEGDRSIYSTPPQHNAPNIVTHAQPVVGNDFQPPKRILAKIIGTPDSMLPTITLNITESVTSWGRGQHTTVRYSNLQEIRIPKYAFKIILFKPGFYSHNHQQLRDTHVWSQQDQDMKFYISTKASVGIWVNGVHLPAHDPQSHDTESKYWGELKNGDIIEIWRREINAKQYTKLRFESLWGHSKRSRADNEPFKCVVDSELLSELEQTCLEQESAILKENQRRTEDEQRFNKEEKLRMKLAGRGGPRLESFSTPPTMRG